MSRRLSEAAETCLVSLITRSTTGLWPTPGLAWRQLTAWWARSNSLDGEEERAAADGLYARLLKSMDRSGAARFVFERYCVRYRAHGFDVTALIPQVYLHYDPNTRRAGGTLTRQRMDFLLLLARRRVVLEVDGIQHYADSEGRASPARYAETAAADRELRLAGYEVYRFGRHDIADRSDATGILGKFFDALLVAQSTESVTLPVSLSSPPAAAAAHRGASANTSPPVNM